MDSPKRGRAHIAAALLAARAPTPSLEVAPPATEVVPISHGESLKFNEGHRRAAREVLARMPRYPGPPEKRSLALLIGDLTNNGAEIAELYLSAARGTLPGVPDPETGECVPQRLEAKDRLAAAKWLGDRYYGKAPDVVQIEGPKAPVLSFDHLSLEERLDLERLMTRAIEGPVTVESDALAEPAPDETQH